MKNKNLTIAIVILMILMNISYLWSQSLIVTRTDVDESKSSFVTATFTFGLDIKLDGVINPRGVVFELQFDNADNVKFSDAKVSGFGKSTTALVIPNYNGNAGIVHIGVLRELGDTSEINQDKIVHVNFSVLPGAVHDNTLTFTFTNAEAIRTSSLGGERVSLSTIPAAYNIHSFVDVWPGDANNDGIVNISDVASIGVFLGYNQFKPTFRGFKREDNSTYWTNQKSLAWDSVAITYADCDGNGDITVSDMLVVGLNFLKSQNVPLYNLSNETVNKHNAKELLVDDNYKQAFKISSNDVLSGIAGTIRFIDSKSYKSFLGLKKGNCLGDDSFIFWKNNDEQMSVDFAVSSFNAEKLIKDNDEVLFIELSDKPENAQIWSAYDLLGMCTDGRIIPIILQILSISEDIEAANSLTILSKNGSFYQIKLDSEVKINSLNVIDINGKTMSNIVQLDGGSTANVSTDALTEGIYMIVVYTTKGVKIFKIMVN